ncbi:tyrosine-type recombinase/integrase [Aureimonas populi]|uniref:Tyrosine-type recombinase/integrase n=1 Tax=Aureimonas populi TaxID=1701758 RepID=A0ABW5CFJ4_9HYPH|nr:tyrosine-type recombinase/integrase [Aureimonas populi]
MRDREGRAVLKTMDCTWGVLKPRFGPLTADQITIALCRQHTKERQAAGISDGTIHTELGHLRTVLKWAEAHRLIDRAPAIERPAKPEPKSDYLTRAQVARMIECAKVPHIALAIRLLIGTGGRVTAALELTWDRVDMVRKLIHLRNPFDKARRKGRATVPINDSLMEALKEAKTGALSPYVIEYGGMPVQSIKRGIKAAAAAAKQPNVSPHVFRHSAAVWMAEAGHSMSEIAQYLGHADSRLTERVYSRYSPDHLRKLAASLDV